MSEKITTERAEATESKKVHEVPRLIHGPSIPELRIIPLEKTILHEHSDPNRVERLASKLKEDGILRNPPIVTEIDNDERYIVLDGANRVSALARLNCKDILVQVESYNNEDLELNTWCHLLTDYEEERFLAETESIDGITVSRVNAGEAEKLLNSKKILCYVIFSDREIYSYKGGKDFFEKTELLSKVVSVYKHQTKIHRITNLELDYLLKIYRNVTEIIVFPQYAPNEIIDLSINGVKLPAGITRHILPRRALRVNLPIDFLMSDMPIESKNQLLVDEIDKRIKENQVRYYKEPTFLFDE